MCVLEQNRKEIYRALRCFGSDLSHLQTPPLARLEVRGWPGPSHRDWVSLPKAQFGPCHLPLQMTEGSSPREQRPGCFAASSRPFPWSPKTVPCTPHTAAFAYAKCGGRSAGLGALLCACRTRPQTSYQSCLPESEAGPSSSPRSRHRSPSPQPLGVIFPSFSPLHPPILASPVLHRLCALGPRCE